MVNAALLILALLAVAPKPAALEQRHIDPAGRFALSYPAQWVQQEIADPTLTAFTAPLEYKSDAFQETVSIRVQSSPAGKTPTLAQARAALRREMEARGAVLGDSDGRSKLAGRDAHRYTWGLTINDLRLSLVQLLAVDQDRLFVVTFTTERGHERIYRRYAEAMLQSFEIDPPQLPATRASSELQGL